MKPTDMAKYYAGGRVVIGALLLLFPGRLMRDLLGGVTDRRTKAVGRMLGARDLLLGLGALRSLDEGGSALRPWMTYGAVADGVDALGFALAYKDLPKRKRFAFVVAALGGAATGGYLVSALDN